MHFTLGKGIEYLKRIMDHDTIVSFLRFNALFFCSLYSFSFCHKRKDNFSPFQQEVHALPK